MKTLNALDLVTGSAFKVFALFSYGRMESNALVSTPVE